MLNSSNNMLNKGWSTINSNNEPSLKYKYNIYMLTTAWQVEKYSNTMLNISGYIHILRIC